MDRRHFLRGASALAAVTLSPWEMIEGLPRKRALRVLILGGTGFVGPHLVDTLVQRGHSVTIFTRGRREPGLFNEAFARVEHVTGDRAAADGLDALKGRTWDVVIETSGYRHPWTRDAVQQLRGAAGRYMYVSSTGVFWPYHSVDIAEDGRILLADDPPQEAPSYGVMKALSENEVRSGFGDGAIIVRPGYIVGPGDTSDRWTYWPVRLGEGGEVPVPGRRADPVQYIDVRDLTAWMVVLLEDGTTGTFNAVGPAEAQTMEQFVEGVHWALGSSATLTWIEDYEWLRAYPLRRAPDGSTSGYTGSIPWVMPEGDELGHMRIDGRRALRAGLRLRPLAETARDTRAWRLSDAAPQALRDQPRYAISREQERELLAAWKAR